MVSDNIGLYTKIEHSSNVTNDGNVDDNDDDDMSSNNSNSNNTAKCYYKSALRARKMYIKVRHCKKEPGRSAAVLTVTISVISDCRGELFKLMFVNERLASGCRLLITSYLSITTGRRCEMSTRLCDFDL